MPFVSGGGIVMEHECEKCVYLKLMTTWGERINACHYGMEAGKEIYGDDNSCSGFKWVKRKIRRKAHA